MPLSAGTQFGRYTILSPLGAGGMGEVYLAEDPKLGRNVALKVLAAEVATDPERLARFEQEARASAALNHPHIAAVFDVGVVETPAPGGDPSTITRTHFMVQEYLEGDTLRASLLRGRLPLTKAIDLATEIAEALSAAHSAGIVHRDLKPENIFVTREGHAKVLDFGLAKLVEGRPGVTSSGPESSESPTMLKTEAGMVMGTPGYMAPEQVLGAREIDHRADVFAFGCLLQEMLTGSLPFRGADTIEKLNSALHEPAEPLEKSGLRLPAQAQWILDKCLAKDPDERYQLTRDLAVRLKHLRRQADSGMVSGTTLPEATRPAPSVPRRLAWLGAGLLGLALGFLGRGLAAHDAEPSATASSEIARFIIALPEDDALSGQIALGGQPPGTVAVSAQGSQIVYAVNLGGRTMLYRRALGDLEAAPIPGTEDGQGPFFYPDGESLGFYSDGSFKSVSLAGGAAFVLAEASAHRGATATADGQVIYVPSINSGLWMVPSAGGKARQITEVDVEAGEYSHRWPYALPDGKTILFTIDRGGSFDEAAIGALSLDSGERKVLLEGGSFPAYAATGHLLFSRQGSVLAVPFDAASLEVRGRPVLVVSGVVTQQDTGAAHFALSTNGTLVYVPGGAETNERTLLLVDERGKALPIEGLPTRAYQQPSLSPDGTRLAVNIVEATHDLWISELSRGTLTRLTFAGDNHSPVWSPDGRRIAFSSERGGPSQLFWIAADGSGEEEELLEGEHSQVPTSFSPQGLLTYTEVHPETRGDLWTLAVAGDRQPRPFLVTQYDEKEAAFSPDGSTLAYVSNESGRYEVFVQPFPGPGRKLQISPSGGGQPIWSRDGQRVFYRSGDRMFEVRLSTAALQAEPPRELFEDRFEAGYIYNSRIYDVAADGAGFIVAKGDTAAPPDRLAVVLHWFGELERRVPRH